MIGPSSFWEMSSASIPAWGDLSYVLVEGWINNRVDGTPYLWRVGPFMPPITVNGLAILVTDAMREKIASRFSYVKFKPVVKERIVSARWETWDRQKLPKLLPPGEPENFILERTHSNDAAQAMGGDVWELWLNVGAKYFDSRSSSYNDRRVRLSTWTGRDLFFVLWNGRAELLVTQEAMEWMKTEAGEWLRFREISCVDRRPGKKGAADTILKESRHHAFFPIEITLNRKDPGIEGTDELSSPSGRERLGVYDWSEISETVQGNETVRDIWVATQFRTVRVWQSRRGNRLGPLTVDLYNERSDECMMKTLPVLRAQVKKKMPLGTWCIRIAMYALWGDVEPEAFSQEVAEFARDVKTKYDAWWETKRPPRKPPPAESPLGPDDPIMKVIREGEAEFEAVMREYLYRDDDDKDEAVFEE